MYEATLDVIFPSKLGPIFQAINIRHDLVHRNGRDKNGVQIELSKEDVETLIANASSFINHIDEQLDSNDEETLCPKWSL